jgi:hypothetical protein
MVFRSPTVPGRSWPASSYHLVDREHNVNHQPQTINHRAWSVERGEMVWWSGGLVVWWSGGLVVWSTRSADRFLVCQVSTRESFSTPARIPDRKNIFAGVLDSILTIE